MEIEDTKEINEKLSHLYVIADFWFTKAAFEVVVFKKLLLDGYVCCTEGLYPTNKESLKKKLRVIESPFFPIIEWNSKSYAELQKRFESIDVSPSYQMTVEDSQSIVYAILEAEQEIGKSVCVFLLLLYYFKNAPFHHHGDFVVANDTNLVYVDSLECFAGLLERIPENRNVFFRGHSNVNYSILPSLFRHSRFYKHEYMLYQELVLRCPEAFITCSSHLEFLVEMQHYGLPTRLLDFSLNPMIALYFACENETNTGEVVVYTVRNHDVVYSTDEKAVVLSCLPMLTYEQQRMLFSASIADNEDDLRACQGSLTDEIRMDRPSFLRDIKPKDIHTPVFVKPYRRNRRIAHQDGAFLLWGLDATHYGDGIDSMDTGIQQKYRFEEDGKKNIYVIRQKSKKGILKSLNRLGINKAFVYPEIDDVADYIKSTITDD